ncbi:Zinc finger CCCH domain-containing protein 13 [Orchesella cincta]|uniref:Zinc finger CCCH domain-containing protein 13 n=1 Tax=Orchesella cincta TaxID=48709 RepID=A0A1D2MFQ7_ORCCI|nr:Zinc finger CCCH domain-containing protein 13 [Orchesella cincta]
MDLREKIKAKTRQNYEGIQHGGTPDLRHQRRPPQEPFPNRGYNKPDLREGSPGSSTTSKRSSSTNHPVRRDRSPLPRDRIRVINSPMRRAPAEDTRRVDVRDISKRLDNYGDNNKPRDIDRYRDDGGPFGRDSNRQKERLAPARPPPGRQHPGHQMNPDRDRDNRGMNDRAGNNRFEPRHSRPLLQLPPGAEPQKIPYRGAPEDRVPRITIQPQSPALNKSGPMIVKSKEALIEKYRVMKQSQYVDMWVDKTVEACAPPGSSIVSPPPPKDTPSVSSRTFDDSAETGTKVSSIKDIEDLLSDFSDDADELLNDVGDERKSDKSENIEKKVTECEAEVASTATVSHSTETNTPIEKEKKPVQSTPTVVTSGVPQDRKSVGTPQRTTSSFIEPRGEGQSLHSRSQTEDDILERMDFEEISDEELGDVGENKIPIVDALGVDWASLVCGEKNRPISPSSVLSTASTSMKVRKRWTPLQVVSRVGLLSNCSEKLLQKVVELKMKEEPYAESSEDPMDLEEKIQDELQNAGKFRKIRARGNVIDTIGLGPNSRALSSRRDMALRRYYLGMPQKSLVSMDMLHQNPASNSVQDLESIGELYRLSLSLFKGSETATVAV